MDLSTLVLVLGNVAKVFIAFTACLFVIKFIGQRIFNVISPNLEKLSGSFKPNQEFFQLRIVKVSIALYLAFFSGSFLLVTISLVLSGSSLQLCGTGSCFNDFLAEFKFPLLLLSSSIPYFALLATQHRSAQVAAQIEASKRTDYFNMYHKHHEEYQKLFTDEELEFVNKNTRQMHLSIFTKVKKGDDRVDQGVYEVISTNAQKIGHRLLEMQAHVFEGDVARDGYGTTSVRNIDDEKYLRNIQIISDSMKRVLKSLSYPLLKGDVPLLVSRINNWDADGVKFEQLEALVKFISSTFNIIEKSFMFDSSYELDEFIHYLALAEVEVHEDTVNNFFVINFNLNRLAASVLELDYD